MTGEAVPLVERLHRSSETTAPDNRQSTIQLVDLVTPQAPSVRVNGEPLEFDLTYDDCDDQSELYLLLVKPEKHVNHEILFKGFYFIIGRCSPV